MNEVHALAFSSLISAIPHPAMQRFKTGNPYEAQFGYSRAVRKGPFISVSGTTSIDPHSGQLLHPDSAGDQARAIFAEIVRSVEALGGTAADVVRVRMFVTNGADVDAVGNALKDALGEVGPAATMIVGAQFVSPRMLVEIEADAVVPVRLCPKFYPLRSTQTGAYSNLEGEANRNLRTRVAKRDKELSLSMSSMYYLSFSI